MWYQMLKDLTFHKQEHIYYYNVQYIVSLHRIFLNWAWNTAPESWRPYGSLYITLSKCKRQPELHYCMLAASFSVGIYTMGKKIKFVVRIFWPISSNDGILIMLQYFQGIKFHLAIAEHFQWFSTFIKTYESIPCNSVFGQFLAKLSYSMVLGEWKMSIEKIWI